jgi:hypothetical protein
MGSCLKPLASMRLKPPMDIVITRALVSAIDHICLKEAVRAHHVGVRFLCAA